MNVEFKFNIGDIVTSKIDMAEYQMILNMISAKALGQLGRIGQLARPVPMRVSSRWLEECPGGIQLHYTVLHRGGDKSFVTARINEDALERYPEELKASESTNK